VVDFTLLPPASFLELQGLVFYFAVYRWWSYFVVVTGAIGLRSQDFSKFRTYPHLQMAQKYSNLPPKIDPSNNDPLAPLMAPLNS
jgi:hypothetical protein